ncbi:bifunctional tetrahydrofolate synthase/dihydrofolate synthase [Methylophaga lonarensis]|uniref:bifunctional tetrahydrofolate synthase/dihydrofolate synthase n=1 Tax=Methylophaga lonarensis TaxID=999151 RepID=UPI003D28344F
MRFDTLPEWLAWQERLHFTEIDPGLDRIAEVWKRMGGSHRLPFTVITVAGTNGKGSSVAMLSSIMRAAGYKTATYTSPHLLAYNERIVIDGQSCSDDEICASFDRIDQARAEISMTYFEFATLAAADIFCREQVDVAVLEVGMGGRLDAVNLFDADIALITPIALDHVAWLGDTREKIGFEKAGIMRAGRPVVSSEFSPPDSIINRAAELAAPLFIAGRDYQYSINETDSSWNWQSSHLQWQELPKPALTGRYQVHNAAAVLQVVNQLQQSGLDKLDRHAVEQGLQQVQLNGRFQMFPGPVTTIFDVTHNQQGAENLQALLKEIPCAGKTHAVVAMLRDKDASAVFASLKDVIDHWYLGSLEGDRGLSGEALATQLLPQVDAERVSIFDAVSNAYVAALSAANTNDRILVFGSFHTVEAIMLFEQQQIRNKVS